MVDILHDGDGCAIGAIGHTDQYDDEQSFINAIKKELIDNWGWDKYEESDFNDADIKSSNVSKEWIRKVPVSLSERDSFSWKVGNGEKGQRGAFEAYKINWD